MGFLPICRGINKFTYQYTCNNNSVNSVLITYTVEILLWDVSYKEGGVPWDFPPQAKFSIPHPSPLPSQAFTDSAVHFVLLSHPKGTIRIILSDILITLLCLSWFAIPSPKPTMYMYKCSLCHQIEIWILKQICSIVLYNTHKLFPYNIMTEVWEAMHFHSITLFNLLRTCFCGLSHVVHCIWNNTCVYLILHVYIEWFV